MTIRPTKLVMALAVACGTVPELFDRTPLPVDQQKQKRAVYKPHQGEKERARRKHQKERARRKQQSRRSGRS